MLGSLRWFVGAVTVLAISAGTVSAQNWKFDAGVNAGGAFRTASISPTAGSDKVRFGPGWLVGSQLGVRLFPRLRLRADGAFGPAATKLGSTKQWDRTELYALSGDLVYSLKEPAAQFTTTEVLPYLAAGAGIRWVRPTGTIVGVLSHDTVYPGIVVGPAAEQYLLEEEEVPMGLVAIGTDIRTAKHLAFRLEAGDRFFKPAVDRLTGHYTITEHGKGSLTHEIYGIAGVSLLFGMPKAPVVATVAPPPPTPPETPVAAQTPTPPPPPPPPPPAEQQVSICVLDSTGAMQDVSATYVPSSGDTVVARTGTRVKIAEAFTAGPALSEQGWYQRGEPLVIGTGARAQKYVPFGTPRTFRAGEVVFVGRVNGMPVLADPTEAKALVDAVGTSGAGDLNKAVVRPVVRRQLGTVKNIYVPARAAGCVLQPLQQQEAVRKVRG